MVAYAVDGRACGRLGPAMARPYQQPREFLDDVLGLVFAVLHRQITVYSEVGFLGRHTDEFSGTFVAFRDVRAMLDGGRAPTPEALARVAELDAGIAADGEHLEARLAASRAAGAPVLLDRLRDAFELSPTELRCLLVLIAVETNPRVRSLMRYLVNDASRVHPDIGFLELAVYNTPALRDLMVRELAGDGALLRHRLIEQPGRRDDPFLLRPLRLSARVFEAAHGIDRLDPDVAAVAELVTDPTPMTDLELPAPLRDEVVALVEEAWVAGRAGLRRPAVVVTGPDGSGRRSLLAGAAAQLRLAVLRVRCAELPRDPGEVARLAQLLVREARLARALLVFEGIDALTGDAEQGRVDRIGVLDAAALASYAGPVAATAARSDNHPVRLGRGVVLIEVVTPPEAVRARLWQRALGPGAGPDLADRAAARYPVTGGVILAAAEAALARARARGGALAGDDLHVGIRATLDSKLSTLGVRLTWQQTWADLVLPDDAHDEVREFIARVRHRRRVFDEWGFARKVAKGLGLSALFSGPPGTGKTMVAGIIADELGLDLYQIDLSRIVSKYVGETEKNLAALFDAADAGHAILLFDEADSLFAKRTDVKSSVDRYANLEVNYLLQRMEQFSGITILTTNLASSIDEAFRRRLSFRVDFPMPEARERERLWKAMLPAEAKVAADIDFTGLAQRFEMTGGYIKNAVVRAAFLAANEDSVIAMRHLGRAASLEYAAMGKVMVAPR